MARYARIVSTGSYVPEKILTNENLSRMLGEDIDGFVHGVIGIRERRVCAEDESTADLAESAARRAIESAGINPEDIDLIIVATDTPEYISPATSSIVQSRLGAVNAATFDVNCACAGFVTAIDAASKFIIADDEYRYVLVIGAYAMTKYLDWRDKKTCTLFADGAGAVLLEASGEGPGFLGSKLAADGNYAEHMGIYAGGARHAVNRFNRPFERTSGEQLLEFVRKIPSTFNMERWPEMIRHILGRNGLTVEDVDHYIFTQLNLGTIRAVMEKLDQPMEKAHTIMEKWGYTGSACIPMALDDARRQGKLASGDVIVLCASGGGVALACAVFRWTK